MKKTIFRTLLSALAICSFLSIGHAQTKGATIATKNLDTASADFNRRYALVIGNATYPNNKLNNPVNDARDMSDLLKKYGFRVLLDTNVSRLQMNRDVNAFGDSILNNKGIGLFYFSGHGIQYNGKNFLLPLDYELKAASDIEDESIPLNKIYEKLSAFKNGRNFVILDACRNNPFYEANPSYPKGLNDNSSHPSNAILFFSTLGGSVAADGSGSNSPFTESLVSTIKAKDTIEFFQVVKQVVRDVKVKSDEQQVPDIIGAPDMDFYFTKNIVRRTPRQFILSIGISRYKDGNMNLVWSVKDARDFAYFFKARNGTQTELDTLFNKSATIENVNYCIAKIKKEARDGDVILVYFNGHLASIMSGKSYYMPFDADFSHAEQTGIGTQEILSLLTDMPCKSLLFLDGASSTEIENAGLSKDLLTDKDNQVQKERILAGQGGNRQHSVLQELVSPGNNVVVFSAAQPKVYAFERQDFQNGLFLYALIMGMKNAESKEHPGFVDVEALASYIQNTVPKLSNGLIPSPKVVFPKGWQNFIIGKRVK